RCSRAANSGTTPPYSAWVACWLATTLLRRRGPLKSTTPAALSSQLLSIPRTNISAPQQLGDFHQANTLGLQQGALSLQHRQGEGPGVPDGDAVALLAGQLRRLFQLGADGRGLIHVIQKNAALGPGDARGLGRGGDGALGRGHAVQKVALVLLQ